MGAFPGDALDSEVLGALYDQVELQEDTKTPTNKLYSKVNQPEDGGLGILDI